LGSMKTRKEALARKAWAEMEVAAGRTPDVGRLFRDDTTHPTLLAAAEAWLRTRVDVAESSRSAYRDRVAYLAPLHRVRVDELDAATIQEWVRVCGLAASTVRNTVTTLHAILDHAGVDPNPAKTGRLLRVPKRQRSAKYLPPRSDLAAVYALLPPRHADLVRLLEHTGLRVSEAVALAWVDVDEARQRFLVAEAKTAAGRRFVSWEPEWCEWEPPHVPTVKAVGDLDSGPSRVAAAASGANASPLGGRLPRGVSVYPTTVAAVQGALAYACKRAGVQPFGPHALRHRHASILLHHGLLSPAEIAARLGHASPSVTLGTYSWLVPPD
jgi:integrase